MDDSQTVSLRKFRNHDDGFSVNEPENSQYLQDIHIAENGKRDILESSEMKMDTTMPPRLPSNVRNTGLKSWRQSIEPPSSIGHLTFLLDCFVISFGPDMPQLGRYHPQSDPELFAVKLDDDWSLSSEEEFPSVSPSISPWTKYLDPERHGGTSSSFCRLSRFGAGHNFERFGERSGRSVITTRRPPLPVSPLSFVEELDFSPGALGFPDDIIIRELSEMRALLERLLENRDLVEWNIGHNGLRDILALLPDGSISSKEPSPHFPVGEWEFEECGICLEVQWLYRRPCCSFAACTSCLQRYYSHKVEQGLVKIQCCNITCNCYVHRDEISARLDSATKEKFHKLLILANEDSYTKTCPRCNHITKISGKFQRRNSERFTCVKCPACQLEWCFVCHAPSHSPLTCKQFRKGDRLLRNWAKEKNHGQLNAQKCPKCKIYIQRTTGCDHMHCTRCKTDFCYKCGDRFRRLKFFGDHYSKLSVFGCKYRFKADRPLQRKVIRGAIFGGKVMAAPILGALALCAGALALGVGVFALPVYGGVRLYRHCEGRHQAKAIRRQPTAVSRANVWECYVFVPDD